VHERVKKIVPLPYHPPPSKVKWSTLKKQLTEIYHLILTIWLKLMNHFMEFSLQLCSYGRPGWFFQTNVFNLNHNDFQLCSPWSKVLKVLGIAHYFICFQVLPSEFLKESQTTKDNGPHIWNRELRQTLEPAYLVWFCARVLLFVNASGEAARGLVRSRVELHSRPLPCKGIKWQLHRQNSLARESHQLRKLITWSKLNLMCYCCPFRSLFSEHTAQSH